MSKCEQIGNATLYLGDCMEILPTLPKVDAVVTDPPYGIRVDRSMAKVSGTQYGRAAAPKNHYESSGWDDLPMSLDVAELLMSKSIIQIMWGGNFYGLRGSRGWLVWDKQNGDNAFADCELAWTNIDMPVRKFSWMWNGMLREGKEPRNGHPTQKPLALMEWCIDLACKYLPNVLGARSEGRQITILDCYMGSGTTGVACMNLGRKFIGIEIEPRYFDIACRRIEQAQKQVRMFE